ncbi:histidine kinase [Solirubrobacter ginsenosidimutans]|uniref:histidine kinase n=1 Tax=Solirubrobacter ginsenosidimutans TaxID=490573 RepID=A0A9X3N3S9_9ACTN|nr:histidine kinase [Solirubrobacter ginsenosidimutans]MDA0166578.1 histidine kinase [Solirubrobacter ginsenosidimutans]
MLLRRHPIPILVAVLAVGIAVPAAIPWVFAALVPLYVLAERDLRHGVAAAAAILLVQLVKMDHPVEPISTVVFSAAVIAVARYRVLQRAAAARERELLFEAAAAEERLRIARELHDAVGHDVSLMVVQAEALAAVTGDERADAIAALGRRTMGEMHRTLKVLRDDADLAPQPGLNDLGGVIEDARGAGVPITFTVEGAPRPLPGGLDASAYRIVQEAVTNVIRHAGGAAAAVTVHYGDDALELRVTDEGGEPSDTNGGGHGLVGMRERVAAFNGTLQVGPRAGHGYEVRAELPYTA